MGYLDLSRGYVRLRKPRQGPSKGYVKLCRPR